MEQAWIHGSAVDKEVQCFEDTNKPKQCFHQSICSLGMDEDLEDNLLGPERSEEAKAAWAQLT